MPSFGDSPGRRHTQAARTDSARKDGAGDETIAGLADTDTVEVLAGDLRLLKEALNTAYGSSAAWDLVAQYQAVASVPRESNLSKKIKAAHNRVAGLLKEAEATNQAEEDGELIPDELSD